MSEMNLINKFPSLRNGMAYPFRYDRWEKLFLLEILRNSEERLYLACYGCYFLRFNQAVPLIELKLLKEAEILVLAQDQHEFLVRFNSMELWSEDKFQSYDVDLFNKFSEKERFGVRQPITSTEEL